MQDQVRADLILFKSSKYMEYFPFNIKLSTCLRSFKRNLKTHLSNEWIGVWTRDLHKKMILYTAMFEKSV